MSDNFTIHDFVYQQDDQRTPDDSNMPVNMFPEYAPIRYHTPWESFHDLEYYSPAEYPHPLMICPPTGSAFDDLVYARRDFHSPEESFYLSTESSPTAGAVVTPFNEMDNEDDSKEFKTHHTCKVHKKSAKYTEPDAKKARPKDKKRCRNCNTAKSPSWRRSVTVPHKGSLLCNACGLYEKTSKSKRMLVSDEEGILKVVRKRDKTNYVCRECGTREATRWKKAEQKLYCEKCAKTHSKI